MSRKLTSALTKPFGTVFIGATIRPLIVTPYLGKAFTVVFWWAAFAASSVPGSILGYFVLKALRMSGLSDRLDFENERYGYTWKPFTSFFCLNVF